MSSALLHAGTVLMAATVVGLWRRGRVGHLRSWTAYLFLLVTWQTLVAVRPGLFNWPAWSTKELLCATLQFLIAVEVAGTGFGRVLRARRLWYGWLFVVGCATVVYLAAVPSGTRPDAWARFVGLVVVPRLNLAEAFLFAGLALIALMEDVPLRGLHKAVLVGLSAYFLVFVVAVDQLTIFGRFASPWSNTIMASAWIVVSGFWAREAWRADEVVGAISVPAPVRRLWPWASPA